MNLQGLQATVIGLAREGTALSRFLASQGALVTVSDRKGPDELAEALAALEGLPVRFVFGGHPMDLLEADVVFASPGVRPETPILVEARRQGIPVSSQTRLFLELCPAPVIGITGSSGKTTTTTLVGKMLEASGYRTWVGGNIGRPLIEHLGAIGPDDAVVMELSSFQLETFAPLANEPGASRWPGRREGISPDLACVLNVTPDHLDRHPTMETYFQAKTHILRYQRAFDIAVLSQDDPGARAMTTFCRGQTLCFSQVVEPEEGAFVEAGEIVVRIEGIEEPVCAVEDVRLLGRHNLSNVLAACAIGVAAGASPEAMAEVVGSFGSLEHRLELVGERKGVRFYNDSIATSPVRAMAALESFAGPIVLLAGGRHKSLPMEEFASAICSKVEHLILFGEAAADIEAVVRSCCGGQRTNGSKPVIHRRQSLEEAVAQAVTVARPGDVVLLSPACVSFDAFRDYAERGRRFKELVKQVSIEEGRYGQGTNYHRRTEP